ncbi:hypothetical protein N7451_012306 [Penicillium sp. IBT 35674x]|nr:hypothetical protein N7451_012306 [Penicillium sp. IBT 35674x]
MIAEYERIGGVGHWWAELSLKITFLFLSLGEQSNDATLVPQAVIPLTAGSFPICWGYTAGINTSSINAAQPDHRAMGSHATPNRIPIPRIPNRHKDLQTRRTAHACDECRSRKTKCDGDKPRCAQCASAGVDECVYSQSQQDKERKQLESANSEVDRYEGLLREISQEVDVSVARKISKALRLSLGDRDSQGEASSVSSTSSASSIGSLDALDTLNEDVNRSKASIATGYHGKSSEVAWMRNLVLKAEVDQGDKEGVSKDFPNHLPSINDSLASVDYHIGSADYPGTRHEDENPYTLPAKALAERLLSLYLDGVQPSLPIIRQSLFVDQFNSLYSGNSVQPGRKWLALLNLVFAISSKLCQITGQDTLDRENKFFSRAQKLIISESLVEDHEDHPVEQKV